MVGEGVDEFAAELRVRHQTPEDDRGPGSVDSGPAGWIQRRRQRVVAIAAAPGVAVTEIGVEQRPAPASVVAGWRVGFELGRALAPEANVIVRPVLVGDVNLADLVG